MLVVPLGTDGKFSPNGKPTECEKFSIGALSGVNMAFDAMKNQFGWDGKFQQGEYLIIECTGVKPASQRGYSPMPEFRLQLTDKTPEQPAPEVAEEKSA
jgi:hypothetical protein